MKPTDTLEPEPTRHGMSAEEVAAELGLTVKAVQAIERRAIRKLRTHPLGRKLRVFW